MATIGPTPLAYPFTLSPVFNRPGSFTMTLPLDDPIAYNIQKHATCVTCERNGQIKWSGSIVNVTRDASAMTMSINAIGWLDEFNHRFVRASEEASLVFTGITGGEIVHSLITLCNAQTSTSGAVWPTHVGFDSASDTQVRTRAYKRGQNYGQAIQELVDIENGLDISVDPVTRLAVTRAPTAYLDRTNVVFGYQIEPFNLDNASQSDDGTNTATRVSAEGSGGIVVPADDDDAILINGKTMRESWVSLSDVPTSAIIGSYANAELVYSRYGTTTYDLKPLPYGDIPRLYDDFELGDKVYLSIDAGALQVENQAIRVFSATIEIDAQGNEIISQIGTSP